MKTPTLKSFVALAFAGAFTPSMYTNAAMMDEIHSYLKSKEL